MEENKNLFGLKNYERFDLLDILPRESDIATMRIVGDLKRNLGFSEEEFVKYNIEVQKDGAIRYKTSDDEIYIEIGNKAQSIIAESLKRLNDANKVTETHLTLFDKFYKE